MPIILDALPGLDYKEATDFEGNKKRKSLELATVRDFMKV